LLIAKVLVSGYEEIESLFRDRQQRSIRKIRPAFFKKQLKLRGRSKPCAAVLVFLDRKESSCEVRNSASSNFY